VLLYSIGKDSSVLLHLALKALGPILPFPLLHVDTTWKFREMIEFRDRTAARLNLQLITHVNKEGLSKRIDPSHSPSLHTRHMKTEALRQALDAGKFDCALGGARRDEERSRAKERVFSHRGQGHTWNPRRQRPEFWGLYNGLVRAGESMRVFPLSNWTELDTWEYILAEKIEIPELYFSKPRAVIEVKGKLLVVDDERLQLHGKTPRIEHVRFRTLGCYPLTAAIPSSARTVETVIEELRGTRRSEREGRLIDSDEPSSMERKKREGYF
jgi:sulfate adenylyltransferase subunit 2